MCYYIIVKHIWKDVYVVERQRLRLYKALFFSWYSFIHVYILIQVIDKDVKKNNGQGTYFPPHPVNVVAAQHPG